MDRFEAYTEDGKPCRACISVEDMMKRGKELAQKKAAAASAQPSTNDKAEVVEAETIHRCDCPVDKDELGRSTWTLLHTMSVYYPEKPTETQKTTTNTFLNELSKTYPCDYCAKDMRKDIAEEPPKLNSRNEFADWMCRLHNKVNQKTGKPSFDCSKVFERWKNGWKDGSCDY